jgi:hypothetical protein
MAVLVAASCALLRAECVPFQDAKTVEGKPACITGKVLKVAQSQSGHWYLDFCENYRECPFTVFVPRSDADRLGNLKTLEGQQVEIYGKVQQYNGRSEIILKDKRQLEGEKKKYVPPDDNRRLSYRNEHSAAMHGPPHHHFGSSGQRASNKRSKSSSGSTTATSSTTAPVVRPQ